MEYFLERTGRVLRVFSLALAGAGGLVLLLMLGLVCANIVLRPLNGGIRGTMELSGYLCALAVGLCMPAAQLAGSHIAAGLWTGSLPRAARHAQRALCSLFCACLLAGAGVEILGVAEYADMMGEYLDGFDFSCAVMALGLALGLFAHAAIFVHESLSAVLLPGGRTGAGARRDS